MVDLGCGSCDDRRHWLLFGDGTVHPSGSSSAILNGSVSSAIRMNAGPAQMLALSRLLQVGRCIVAENMMEQVPDPR